MVHLSAISILCPVLFKEFISTYNKVYDTETEYNKRLEIFCKNYEFIDNHNRNDVTFSLDINQFADLTAEEFNSLYTPAPILLNQNSDFDVDDIVYDKFTLPKNFDWREDNHVSAVKNQAICGSCWTFSTTGSIESHYSIYKNEKVLLSEQELVDCSWMYGNLGCSGGMVDRAYRYIKRFGLSSEKDYPYTAKDNVCKFKSIMKSDNKTFITGWKNVQPLNETRLTETLYNIGPIAIAIDASGDAFRFYKSGIYDNCGYNLNHAVLLVGYGVENGQEYYTIKNSWGETYGDKGYIKVARGKHPWGTCGLAMMPNFPIVV